MSRKSALAINLLCSVSILALANSGWLPSETAEAGPANRKAASALSSRARGIKAPRLNGRISSRRGLQLSGSRRALQPKRFSKTGKLTGKPSARRIKTAAPTVGNPRLSIGGADSRFRKLGKVSRSRGFGRVQNINTPGGQTKTSLQKNRVTTTNPRTAPVANSHVLMKGKKINPNTQRSTGAVKFEGKPVARHLDLTATKGNLPEQKGSENNFKLFTLNMGINHTSGSERRGGKAFEIDSYDFGRETTLNPERQRIEFLRLLGLPVRPAGSSSTAPFGHTIGLGHEHQNPTDSTGAASSQPSFGAGLAQPLFEGNSDSSAGIRMQLGRVVVDSDHNEGTSDNANVAFQFNPDTLSRTKSNTSAGTDRARFSEVVLATTPFESIETAHVLPFIAEGDKNSEKEGKPLLIIAEDVEGESGLPPGKRQHKPVSVVKPATSCPNPGDYPPGC